ncbi:MAG: hypothetical protein EPN69_02845 [Rhodanobacter sp.]|nr:MAG: hypothetical protein EPN71_09415 [Rhodanobacter sp.]TAL97830.1 MAG: hypothetical protein EPN69_02845 [Rhodanobacter sp.]TAM41550.1 MAG: hypothetical protein EPN58_06170 [Rhodanobacter sp.]TAN28342.1 MAG: hypothetical protein EPN32_03195 [Rhodanobacter sp.]
MKRLLLSSVLLLAPLAVHAECSVKDFAITEFTPAAASGLAGRLSLRGQLMNNCTTAAAAQIRIELKDDSGKVLQSRQAWPAGTSNITPGKTVRFDLGRLFHYQLGVASYTASVVAVRAW